MLQRYPSPQQLRTAGRGRLAARLRKLAPRIGERIAGEVWAALAEQTVVVSGTDAASKVISPLAEQLIVLRRQRTEVAEQIERLVADHPLAPIITSLPGTGSRTAARCLWK